jgi:hypothetical protein
MDTPAAQMSLLNPDHPFSLVLEYCSGHWYAGDPPQIVTVSDSRYTLRSWEHPKSASFREKLLLITMLAGLMSL